MFRKIRSIKKEKKIYTRDKIKKACMTFKGISICINILLRNKKNYHRDLPLNSIRFGENSSRKSSKHSRRREKRKKERKKDEKGSTINHLPFRSRFFLCGTLRGHTKPSKEPFHCVNVYV